MPTIPKDMKINSTLLRKFEEDALEAIAKAFGIPKHMIDPKVIEGECTEVKEEYKPHQNEDLKRLLRLGTRKDDTK